MKMYFNGTLLDNSKLSQLQRAVVISLFTWQRAEQSDHYDGLSQYGWWGDTFAENPNDRIGSKLYQLFRRKLTGEVLLEAQEMCESALQWLVDDGKVHKVEVVCERAGINQLTVTVNLYINNSSNIFKFTEI